MINNINLVVDDGEKLGLDIDANIVVVEGDPYTGSYTVTPSSVTQTLDTANKTMVTNVTINPIPSNYGLITWDGSTLTVS